MSRPSTLPPKIARDHRIDLVRGFALACIFINHIPDNWYSNLTTRNFGFSDAAELFVLLAGVSAALAYLGRFEQGTGVAATLAAWRRSGKLYVAHIACTALAIALFWAAAVWFEAPQHLDAIGIRALTVEPWLSVLGIVTGGYQLGYFDILPMYVLLMLMLPGLLWLAARDIRLMLAVSAAVYLAAQLLPLRMPTWPEAGVWFFNPYAWQLLFACGIAMGWGMRHRRALPFSRIPYALCVAWLAFSAAWCLGAWGGRLVGEPFPDFSVSFHKGSLALPRLAHVLALTYVVVYSPLWPRLTTFAARNPLTVMGRQSLPIFCLGSLLSMAGWIILMQTGGGLLIDTILVLGGLAALMLVAHGLDGRGRSATAAAPQSPPLVTGATRSQTETAVRTLG